MKLTKKKQQVLTKLSAIGAITTALILRCNLVFAEGAIGTQEVTAATDNIKRVITSIAMPLRRSINFCKYCYCSN